MLDPRILSDLIGYRTGFNHFDKDVIDIGIRVFAQIAFKFLQSVGADRTSVLCFSTTTGFEVVPSKMVFHSSFVVISFQCAMCSASFHFFIYDRNNDVRLPHPRQGEECQRNNGAAGVYRLANRD